MILTLFSKINHSRTGHRFPDDVQTCVHELPFAPLLHLLMSSNRLSLNSFKARPIYFSSAQQLEKLDFALGLLSEKFHLVTFSSNVRDLIGYPVYYNLTFSAHISKVACSSYIQLRRLRRSHRFALSSTFTSTVRVLICFYE